MDDFAIFPSKYCATSKIIFYTNLWFVSVLKPRETKASPYSESTDVLRIRHIMKQCIYYSKHVSLINTVVPLYFANSLPYFLYLNYNQLSIDIEWHKMCVTFWKSSIDRWYEFIKIRLSYFNRSVYKIVNQFGLWLYVKCLYSSSCKDECKTTKYKTNSSLKLVRTRIKPPVTRTDDELYLDFL